VKKWKWKWMLVATAVFLLFQPAEIKAKTHYLSWDPPDIATDVVGYKVYSGMTYSSVANKEIIPVDVGNRLSFCLELADGLLGAFFAVTTYNAAGYESILSNIAYFLAGNIVGDCNSESDCTPYQNARVDGQDLAIMGRPDIWGQTVTHQVINCSAEFVVQIPTLKQKADLNKDGRIDGKDQTILGQRWGKTLPP